jgi:hypothetical protein
MTDKDAMKLALDALDIVKIHYTQSRHINEAITALKERLAQEKALQALHDENERLGLYKDAYAEQEQEPVACRFCRDERGCWAWQCNNCGEIDDLQEPAPPQRTEQNFCSRCGKRTNDIHTCTPPKENT